MNQTILPASLLTAAIKVQLSKIAVNKQHAVIPVTHESFLHQLFFGMQTSVMAVTAEEEKQWNEPNAFSSYE